ncbi:MAG TPA: hypothetical protein VKF32_16455 [Thermoanaerobaculia bacterium]|nr:hypothetical protein [Thermoanaerobaculia bacterium]
MTTSEEPFGPTPTPESPEAAELDRRIEALLDELVAQAPPHEAPADLTARVLAKRPFAPWEVRHGRAWRLPAAAGAGLLGASAGLFLAPLWRLGPGTALQLWAKLTAATLASPLEAALASGTLLAEAAGKVSSGLPGPGLVLLGSAAVLAAGALALGVARPARESVRRAPAR